MYSILNYFNEFPKNSPKHDDFLKKPTVECEQNSLQSKKRLNWPKVLKMRMKRALSVELSL